MKRLIIFILTAALLLPCTGLVSASETAGSTTEVYTTVLDDGMVITHEITVTQQARSTTKTAGHKVTVSNGDDTIAVIAIQATFQYDGSSVSVVSKTVTQADTYGGWSFTQNSFTSSGGTVMLEGTLKYLLFFSAMPVTVTLSCDKNGNISHS